MIKRNLDPFNIRILDLNPSTLRGVGEVTSLDFFDTVTKEFHDDGLFSIRIFGPVGDKRRKTNFGFIDIRLEVFHPVVYRSLVALRGLYADILAGRKYAVWNETLHDFEPADELTGRTGFTFFLEYWKDIEFKRTRSFARSDRIDVIEKYKDIALTRYIIVMPAGLRDLEVGPDGRPNADEINDFYRKMLSIRNTVPEHAIDSAGDLLDNSRWRLQQEFIKLYEHIEGLTAGKKQLFMDKFASRRIQNGTRNVISAFIPKNKILGEPGSVSFKHNVVGIYQGAVSIRPITIYRMKEMLISKAFYSPEMPARLIDKKTLQQVEVNLPTEEYDTWMTEEGLTRLMSLFSNIAMRHDPIVIGDHYLALVYKGKVQGKEVFKVFFDIRDLPDGFNKKDVHPLTFTELLYLPIYEVSGEYPCLNVRYPIDNIGSIQPSTLYIKTTVPSQVRTQLSEDWEVVPEAPVAFEYPVAGNSFHDTSSPHIYRLASQGGDEL